MLQDNMVQEEEKRLVNMVSNYKKNKKSDLCMV